MNTHNLCFRAKIRKIMYTTVNPRLTFKRSSGLRGLNYICVIARCKYYVGISGSPCFGQAYINLGSRDESVPRCFRLREDNSGAISRGASVIKENTKI